MKIKDIEQLEKIRKRSKRAVTGRALAAGIASAMPGAIAGVAADVTILLELLPKINKDFGLDPAQIDELDEQAKQQFILLVGGIGSNLIGKSITKELILTTMKAVGVRTTAKAAASWVPVVGSAAGGVLGFSMMKYVGNKHVEECYNLARKMLEVKSLEQVRT